MKKSICFIGIFLFFNLIAPLIPDALSIKIKLQNPDGIENSADLYDDNDGVLDTSGAIFLNPTTIDTDNDFIEDNTDPDDDNDGVIDTLDEFPLDPTEWYDSDKDGIGDNSDLDGNWDRE